MSELSHWLSISKDAITSLASIVGVTVAVLGLKTWRRQLLGHAEYDLARRYLRAVLKVRDTIRLVRSPFMSSGEISAALKDAGIEDDFEKVKQSTYSRLTYAARWNRLNEARSDLRVEALEAEVLWGSRAQELLKPLDQAIGELYAALHRYLDGLDKPYDHSHSPDEDRWEKVHSVIYEVSNDPGEDKFTAKVGAAVKSIENFVSPRLRP